MNRSQLTILIEQFDNFWKMDRSSPPCIAITAPKATTNHKPMPTEPVSLQDTWLDEEYRYEKELTDFDNTYYGGCAFPNAFSNLGPGVVSACLGSSVVFGKDTVWFDTVPVITDWEKAHPFRLPDDTMIWEKLLSLTKLFTEQAGDRYICGISDLGGNLDILSALRGSFQLLTDLFDYPDKVREAVEAIDKAWMSIYSILYNITTKSQKCCSTWMPLLSTVPWYPLQCDFSSMISPCMFNEFVVPALRREASFLSRSIYHLDGPGELPHLDTILDIPEINGIQWVPGTKLYSPDYDERYYDLANEEWFSIYRKIQGRGKNLVLMNARPSDVDRLVTRLKPTGLYISTECDTEEEATCLESLFR